VESAIAADAGNGIRRHAFGDWPLRAPKARTDGKASVLPDWLAHPAPVPAPPQRVLSPSDLGGAKALPGETEQDTEAAKRRGTALHLLLERLPDLDRNEWSAHASGLIGDPALAASLLAEASLVLDNPDLAALFAPGSLAEVAISGDWAGVRLTGSIDRLLVEQDRVRIIDYKSNALVPDNPDQVPEGILRQLGAYAHLVSQVYPARRIETAVLWTRAPRLMPLDPEIVRRALGRATIP
jgi:ATP-dependent helicase/nuclease subunit A